MNKLQPNVRTFESRAAWDDFWLKATELSLGSIWDNCEDEVYAELLEASMITSGGNDEHIRRNN